MKIIVVVLALVAVVYSSPLKNEVTNRRYFPEENDPYRIKYFFYKDENNKIHFEDLTKETKPTKAATIDDVTLYLYTRSNSDVGIPIRINNLNDLNNQQLYDPAKINFFIIHGWNNDYKSDVNVVIKKAILAVDDINVFVVDWSRPANKNYIYSFNSVKQIGTYLGNFIKEMSDRYNLSSKMIKMVGHSLGAHVAGCTGAAINGAVDYIVGLDPAGPLFSLGNKENRLDPNDAEFVHIIHTSGSVLGFGSSIGNADYFPNSGDSQPGCGIDLIGTCAHSRAYYYYAESIFEGNFHSIHCNSYKEFKKGTCENNKNSYLGTFQVDKRASGDYYLDTNKKSPFALG